MFSFRSLNSSDNYIPYSSKEADFQSAESPFIDRLKNLHLQVVKSLQKEVESFNRKQHSAEVH